MIENNNIEAHKPYLNELAKTPEKHLGETSPGLEGKLKIYSSGEKKTGFSKGNNQLTKHEKNFQAEQHSSECKIQPIVPQHKKLPQLACLSKKCSQEKKTKMGIAMGILLIGTYGHTLLKFKLQVTKEMVHRQVLTNRYPTET